MIVSPWGKEAPDLKDRPKLLPLVVLLMESFASSGTEGSAATMPKRQARIAETFILDQL